MEKSNYRLLDRIGRVRLSEHFWFRDFLYSETSNAFGNPNVPTDVELAIYAGENLCQRILEPLWTEFGQIKIRSGYRSKTLNAFGHANGLNCADNRCNRAYHIWDQRDENGHAGAAACVVVPALIGKCNLFDEMKNLGLLVGARANFHRLVFFAADATFNIGWHEKPISSVYSYKVPRGWIVEPSEACSVWQ
jgi:hypothetical protein